MGDPVVHFDLNGPDPELAAAFYSKLFDWHTRAVPGGYILIDTHAGTGINGGFSQVADQPPSSVFYVEVEDVQGALDKAESAGAKTVVPRTVIPDLVTYAVFLDPQGNAVGLVQGDQGDGGGPSAGGSPPVAWFELQCADPASAWALYRDLFGWDIEGHEGEFAYGEIDTGGGRGIRGGIGSSPDGQPHVNLYAMVDDLPGYLERAESLGGKAVVQPMEVDSTTSIAMIADPQGTTFGLYSRRDQR